MNKSGLVSLLRTNLEEFRRIRERDPRTQLDLSGADLSGCNLKGAPLAGVNLRNASLRNADSTDANFRFTDLSGADLRGARLEGANLHETIFEGADMRGATLGGIERKTRICLHVSSFRDVRWSREEMEVMMGMLNQNPDWEIRYQIVPKSAPA